MVPTRPWRTSVLLIGPTRGANAVRQVERDLQAIREVLTDPDTGIALPERTLTLDDPTEAEVVQTLCGLRRGLRDDLLVCYFSGHGSLDPDDQSLRLGMADSVRDFHRSHTFGLPYRRLAEELRATRARRIVVILDCCWSGTALWKDRPPEGFCVLTSVQGNRRTPQPREDGALSPYTEALIRALRQPPPGSPGVGRGRLAARRAPQQRVRGPLPLPERYRRRARHEGDRRPLGE